MLSLFLLGRGEGQADHFSYGEVKAQETKTYSSMRSFDRINAGTISKIPQRAKGSSGGGDPHEPFQL
jgi:hypothetical protein